MKRGTFPFIILGFLDIIISISGLYIWRILSGKSSTVLVMTSILLALSTYFGFVAISQSLGKGPTSNMGSIRTAIASGILVLYFFGSSLFSMGKGITIYYNPLLNMDLCPSHKKNSSRWLSVCKSHGISKLSTLMQKKGS